jgi:hypothetical protein
VYEALRKTPTTTVLMFLDTCRTEFLDIARADNVSLEGERSIVRGRGIAQLSKGFTFFTGDINTFVSFSTQPGNVAQDGNNGNSPYASALTKHMKVAGIDLSAVMARTRKDVYEVTSGAQTPWDHSSLTSTFEFRICAADERVVDGECRVPPKPVVVAPPPGEPPSTNRAQRAMPGRLPRVRRVLHRVAASAAAVGCRRISVPESASASEPAFGRDKIML